METDKHGNEVLTIELSEEEQEVARKIAQGLTAHVGGVPCRAVVVIHAMALAMAAYSLELDDKNPNVGATVALGMLQTVLQGMARKLQQVAPIGTA